MGPAVYSFLLYDPSKANINTYVRVVTFAFTWGYFLTFALELVVVRDLWDVTSPYARLPEKACITSSSQCSIL